MDILNPRGLAQAGPLIEQVQHLWGSIQTAWQNKDLGQLGPLCQQTSQTLVELKGIFPQQGEELDRLAQGLMNLPKVMDEDNADAAMKQVEQAVGQLTNMG